MRLSTKVDQAWKRYSTLLNRIIPFPKKRKKRSAGTGANFSHGANFCTFLPIHLKWLHAVAFTKLAKKLSILFCIRSLAHGRSSRSFTKELVQILDTQKWGRGGLGFPKIILIRTNSLDFWKNRPKINTQIILSGEGGRGFGLSIWTSSHTHASFCTQKSIYPNIIVQNIV